MRKGEEDTRKKRKGENREEGGKEGREPCSHYSSWETSCSSHSGSHNSSSWRSRSTIILSGFALPGWHSQEEAEAGRRARRMRGSRDTLAEEVNENVDITIISELNVNRVHCL